MFQGFSFSLANDSTQYCFENNIDLLSKVDSLKKITSFETKLSDFETTFEQQIKPLKSD